MIRFRGTVELKSGETIEFKAGTAAIGEWEAYARRHEISTDMRDNPITWSEVVACYCLTGTLEGFEAWRATVFDVDLQSADGEASAVVPPTLREASGA
jgi:hypothetical protein